jgi:hypothetical protein
MLDSFRETASPNTHVLVYLDIDDPMKAEYHEILYKKWPYYVEARRNVAQIHNFIVDENPNYDFYMPINDDITFKTKGWDKILIDAINTKGGGWGIAYPDDTTENWKHNLPTFGMMSGNIVEAIGHFYPRELKMFYGDNFLLDLGRAIGKLFYCEKAIVKHTPPGVAYQAFVPDDIRNRPGMCKEENLAYAKYIDTELDLDVQRIFEAIINEKQEVNA